MTELAQYFSGEVALTRVKKNENLQGWFTNLASEILTLDYHEPIVAGRKISQLRQALEDVEEFHQVEASLQVKQFLMDTRSYLATMIRTVNVSEKVLTNLDIVSDFSYAWILINDYTNLMHDRINKDPAICLLLRSTFLKLSSILSLPLVRITQCGSKDDISVASFYSTALVSYVRKVLEIIPKSVFQVLDQIVKLQSEMKELPTKLERKYLKDFSQLDQRYQMAKLTHQVSVFTEGVLAMKTTLVGIVEVDPRKLLEDGIRKELVRQNALAMHDFLVFKTGMVGDFEARLKQLGAKLDGFRQSFEYIQDYINVYGLKMLQQELSRIINFNVEQESNSFLKKKIYPWQSQYQSDAIPIPQHTPINLPKAEPSVNFMGRLARELIHQTSPSHTVYVESMQGWFDAEKEVHTFRTHEHKL
jgi:WASH complex subunit strumpellin